MRTVRTDQRVPSRPWLVPLPIGEAGDDLHRALDDAFHLGQRGLQHALHLGERLGGRHPVRAAALEPLGDRVLPHAANTRGDSDGCMLHPALIMVSATPFCFCTTQKYLAVKRIRSSM